MLVLVRHGESEANAAGLIVGRQDPPLTSRGRDEAKEAASLLGELVALVSSPLARAQQTAELVALEKGGSVTPSIDERWMEVDYGELEGRRIEDVPPETWQAWQSDPAFRPPGGESLLDVARRVEAACLEIFAPGSPGRDPLAEVVVVSHVSPIKAALAWALGTGVEVSWRIHLATASVSRIGWREGRPVVHLVGAVGRAPS